MRFQPMLIDGNWVKASDCGEIEVTNPATEEVFVSVPKATNDDIVRAITSANKSFPSWAKLSPAQRAEYLYKASVIVMDRYKEIGKTMTAEQGKPLPEAQGEVKKGADILRFYAEEGQRIHGRIIADAQADIESRVIYEPVGPVVAISPWNYPIELVAWKIAAALAAGCTIVVKPPSLTPVSPLLFIKCLDDAGVPAGVINACPGPGSTVGRQLIENSLIKKVAFTGSTEVGRKIIKDCAANMKKVSLELGGHCPLIVCKDGDMDEAVKGATRRSFRNMGQICIAINRIYVQREVFDEFLNKFIEAVNELEIGDGLKKIPCDLGPMANQEGIEKAQKHIQDALQKGAKLACGGKRPEGQEFSKGYFFQPTILSNVNHDMLVMKEETFGPVVGVMVFDSLDQAIELANDTPYGLASYAFTSSLDNAERLCRELKSGNVAVNNVDASVINAPYGGWKDSGQGYEHGPEGLYEYLKAKHLRIRFLNSGR